MPRNWRWNNHTRAAADMAGKRYGDITAVRPSALGPRVWWFRCDLGHEFQRQASSVRTRAAQGHHHECPECRAARANARFELRMGWPLEPESHE